MHVVYGVVGYKTHAKMMLVVRREDDGHPPLLPPGHRQLPPQDRARLHRLRPAHRQRGHRRRRARDLPAADQPHAHAEAAAAAAVAVHDARARCCRLIARETQRCARVAGGRIIAQHERADRAAGDRGAVRGLARRRADRPDRARHLRAAARRRRASRTTSACVPSSAASSSIRACGVSAKATRRELYLQQRRLDGAQPLPARRDRVSRSSIRVCGRNPARTTSQLYLEDTADAWLLQCRWHATVRADAGRAAAAACRRR